MEDFYERKDVSNDTIQFKITVPQDQFEKEYNALLKKELENTDMKGFRKGKVPTDFVDDTTKSAIKIKAFETLTPMLITTILQKENIEPIAPPEYKDLPDFDSKKPITFTMDITVMPDFKLGNLKKVKVKKEEVKVEDKEIEEALENIKKSQDTKEKELNDEWAKEIGKLLKLEEIETLDALKKYIEDTLLKEKEHINSHKLEDDALKQAIEVCEIKIPEPAVRFEAQERERSFITDMQQRGVNVEDFLKGNNITIEKMRELWMKDAQQALENDVFLKIYAKERDIKVTDEDLRAKIDMIRQGAPKETDEKIFENEQWKEYIRLIEKKEQAFKKFAEEVLGK